MTKANAVSVGKVSRVSCRSANTAKEDRSKLLCPAVSKMLYVRLTFEVGSIISKLCTCSGSPRPLYDVCGVALR